MKGTIHLGLIYSSNLKYEEKTKVLITPSLFGLIEYKDSNYTKNPEDRKSVIEYCYFIKRAIVSWYNKKQRTVSIFKTKAKYIIFGYTAQEVI